MGKNRTETQKEEIWHYGIKQESELMSAVTELGNDGRKTEMCWMGHTCGKYFSDWPVACSLKNLKRYLGDASEKFCKLSYQRMVYLPHTCDW